MEELLELTKKQLRVQKVLTTLLACIVVLLLAAGAVLADRMNQMSVVLDEVVEKVETVDVNAMNDMIYQTQELIESTDTCVSSMNESLEKMRTFQSWLDGVFGN